MVATARVLSRSPHFLQARAHLVRLEVDHDEYFTDLLHRNGVSGKVSILHHLAELIRLDGKRSTNTLTWRETIEVENVQEDLIKWSDNGLHLGQ